MCRARPDSMKLVQGTRSSHVSVARKTRSGTKLARTEPSGCNDPEGVGAMNGGSSGY